MAILQIAAFSIIAICIILIVAFYFFQTQIFFYPGKLAANHKFRLSYRDEEVVLPTKDGEKLNGLFFRGTRPEVVLYFHGNAGDLNGWQFVAEDFTACNYNIFIIDYRGYGKSTGQISEKGFYTDAEAAYYYLIAKRNFPPDKIIIYGRSIGTGVAIELASKHSCRGLVLEAPYTSLKRLANEKIPFFRPSWYMRFHFDNLSKINKVKCPVIFFHGSKDALIPSSHSEKLFKAFNGKKEKIVVTGGSHNDLNSFPEHQMLLMEVIPVFFTSRQNLPLN
jgi:fermentation-respiration switch protein FrsA (DUF1100 family)